MKRERLDAEAIMSRLTIRQEEVLEIDAEIRAAIQRVKAKKRLNADERIPVSIGGGENDEASDPWEESEDFALGSISTAMMGAAGFEPATSRV